MTKAKEVHGAMYLNYRRAYFAKTGEQWPGTDDQLEGIINENQGSTGAETDEWVLEGMQEAHATLR